MTSAMAGEIVVAGLMTGGYLIEDIRINVPHQVAVRIPADLAMQSKDLWRAIQQRLLFKLDAGAGIYPVPVSSPSDDNHRIAVLEAENKTLRQELDAERQRNQGLQVSFQGLQASLRGLELSLGRMESSPRVYSQPGASPVVNAGTSTPEVVGGGTPTFVPSRIRPETNVDAKIQTTTETSEKGNVSAAANKLKEMRRQAESE